MRKGAPCNHGRLKNLHEELVSSENRAATSAAWFQLSHPLGPELLVNVDSISDTEDEVTRAARKLQPAGQASGNDNLPERGKAVNGACPTGVA